MKNSITLSLILCSILSAGYINPLAAIYRSTDHGGSLFAIDAYKDNHEVAGA